MTLHAGPEDPDKVRTVIRLRNKDKLKWREIAAIVGDSIPSTYLLYKRWCVNGRIRGPRGRPEHERPNNLRQINRIIHLKEQKGLTWREIGAVMGMSHQAPYLRYKKWRQWVRDNKGR